MKVDRKGVSCALDSDGAHKFVKMFYNKNHFLSLQFCGTNTKPHGVRGMSKHHHMGFDPKLENGICAICRIPCSCDECTSILDKPWVHGFPPKQQPHYQPITDCTYWQCYTHLTTGISSYCHTK